MREKWNPDGRNKHLALSIFFFSAYHNLFQQVSGASALRAVMLIIGLGSWYGLTYQLIADRNRKQPNWMGMGIYLLGAVIIILMVINRNEQIRQLVAESQTSATELSSIADEMIGTIETHPDPAFIKTVEEGLRNLSDTITLGHSPLASQLKMQGDTHVERGRQLQQLLIESINSMKPVEQRPAEPLPRVWYNHAVLYDAYVEGVPNREIMARLYISEGTFNRTRRNALRGLARLLVEKNAAIKTRLS